MASPKELKEDFEHLIKNGTIAHGYIFFGSGGQSQKEESDKLYLAKALARYYEWKTWEDSKKEPLIDTMIVDTYQNGGIDDVRSAIWFLWQKPLGSKKRILIIDKAERLTLPAQQAILKIAEEPPPHALIIFVVRDPGALIQPLASRFQKIFFSGNGHLAINKRSAYNKLSQEFKKADRKRRSEIIKEVIQDERLLDQFVADIITMAYRDRVKNVKLLKALLNRLRLIKQYNTNKKLQLESVLLEMPNL